METSSENSALVADIWQKIPPEEKLQLLARAQSVSISAMCCFLLFTGSMAVGLKLPWVFWGSFFAIPVAFQIVVSKAWISIKPRAIIEYAIARGTASHYAMLARGTDLHPALVFKGKLQDPHQNDTDLSEVSEDEEHHGPVSCWVTLFPDSVVIFSENQRGARREFARTISDAIEVSLERDEDESVSSPKSMRLSVVDEESGERSWTITSTYPASLVAFERKLLTSIERFKVRRQQEALERARREELERQKEQESFEEDPGVQGAAVGAS